MEMIREEPWVLDAACKGHPYPEIWFPAQRGADTPRMTAAAKAICVDCPVRRDCLDYARRNHVRHGIWGGVKMDRER